MSDKVSDEDLEKALLFSAQIVVEYGDKYLPVFLRFEKEIDEREMLIVTEN